MLIKTRGIVFRTKKYAETSVITDVFTEEKGMRSYLISGVRTQKAKVSAGLLQVMSLVDIVAYHRDEQDLTRVKEIKAHHVYNSIPFDVRKGAVGMFMIEIARKTIQGHEAWPELFQFLLNNFIFLDSTHQFNNVHLHFMVSLTEYLGFLPGGAYSAGTPFFDLSEGIFYKNQPAHPHWLTPDLGNKLNQFLHLPLGECHKVSIDRMERRSLLKGLLVFYSLHIDNFPEIHSHRILEEVLS